MITQKYKIILRAPEAPYEKYQPLHYTFYEACEYFSNVFTTFSDMFPIADDTCVVTILSLISLNRRTHSWAQVGSKP